MSTPIFDKLAAEFAAAGKQYDRLVKPIPTGLPKRVRPYVPAIKGAMAPGMYIDEWQATVPTPVVEDTDTISLPVINQETRATVCPPGAGAEGLRAFLEAAGQKMMDHHRQIAAKYPDAIQARVEADGSVSILVTADKLFEEPWSAPSTVKPLSERKLA